MFAILSATLLSAFSTNALAAPASPGDLGAPAAQELSLSVHPQALGAGRAASLRLPAGSADRLDMPDGFYDLVDEDGSPGGLMTVRPDGSIVVSGRAAQSHGSDAHARAVTVAEVYNYSDGDCTYTSVYIGWSDGTGSWSFSDDCAIEVR